MGAAPAASSSSAWLRWPPGARTGLLRCGARSGSWSGRCPGVRQRWDGCAAPAADTGQPPSLTLALPVLEALIEPREVGAPISPLLWSTASLRGVEPLLGALFAVLGVAVIAAFVPRCRLPVEGEITKTKRRAGRGRQAWPLMSRLPVGGFPQVVWAGSVVSGLLGGWAFVWCGRPGGARCQRSCVRFLPVPRRCVGWWGPGAVGSLAG